MLRGDFYAVQWRGHAHFPYASVSFVSRVVSRVSRSPLWCLGRARFHQQPLEAREAFRRDALLSQRRP